MITQGTPVVGNLTLSNGALGPTAFTLYVNGAVYATAANERLYVTGIFASSNDATQALITVDDGPANARKLASVYLAASLPPAIEEIAAGIGRLQPGATPRGTASAITSGKFIQLVITGYIARQ
jgi:hypothetical protein